MSEKIKIVACVVGILILVYLVHSYNKSHESFQNQQQNSMMDYTISPSTEAQGNGFSLNEGQQDMQNYGGNVATPEQVIDKKNFRHYMLKEIYDQPDIAKHWLDKYLIKDIKTGEEQTANYNLYTYPKTGIGIQAF